MTNYCLSQTKTTKKMRSDSYLTSYQRQLLQKNLEDNLPKQHRQRITIMLMADEGKTQTEICKTLNCSPVTVRHWTTIAKSGQADKWKELKVGRPQTVNHQYLERLKQLASRSPKEYGYVFKCWTANWLSKHLAAEFEIELSARHINRLLKQMGLSTKQKGINKHPIPNLNIVRDLSRDFTSEPSMTLLKTV